MQEQKQGQQQVLRYAQDDKSVRERLKEKQEQKQGQQQVLRCARDDKFVRERLKEKQEQEQVRFIPRR